MSIDPQVIHAEEYREIGLLIQRDAELVVRRWSQRAVQEEPHAHRVHHEALLNHLPIFLQALGRSLAESDPAMMAEHCLVAARHGVQRWENGWSLTEVVRDYQILRLVLVDYLEEGLERTLDPREVKAVGLSLDEAISASVARYVQNREEDLVRVQQERVAHEQQARAALQKWERLFQAAGWGVAILAPDPLILQAVNPAFAALHGSTVEEVQGRPLTDLLTASSREELSAQLGCVDNQGHHVYEAQHVRKDGSTFPVLTDITVCREANGEISCRVASFQDISQRKQLEHALQEQAAALQVADRRKDEFLAVLAHELRNPLAPMLNSVQVLQLLGSTDPTVLEVQEILERQTKQLARLVDDLLDLSRVARGKLRLRKERLNLATAVNQALQTSAPLLEGRRHELTVSLPSQPVWLEADPSRLVQVLVNLLNNAGKYTDPGGKIWLEVERVGEDALVRVRDTGVGIPADVLPHLFDLFMQVEDARDRSQGGLGIGLALVRRLVELHGGTVQAHSAGPGQGSEFTVRLPVLPETDSPPPPPPSSTAVTARHILIIEDDPDSRSTLKRLLEMLGHRVELAEDGAVGLAAARASRPEVALVDLGLPVLDGYQVAQQIRAEHGERSFLVALTGFGLAEDRQRALEAGFNAHLVKPVELKELSRLLETVPRLP